MIFAKRYWYLFLSAMDGAFGAENQYKHLLARIIEDVAEFIA
jgi:hypothetical protein